MQMKLSFSQINVHSEDNDQTLEGRINDNSLQHKIVAILKYLQTNVLLCGGEKGGLIIDWYQTLEQR